MPQTLVEQLNSLSDMGYLKKDIPEYVSKNITPRFTIRAYQSEAFARFHFYLTQYKDKKLPVHLLFHMATGSGKTLLMATNILYLYEQGYRNFIFFVNSTNIIKKTEANFLDKGSSKYLFADRIMFSNKEIKIKEVSNFEGVNRNNINILFTTIQGLHSRLNNTQENAIAYEDFEDSKIAFVSDEAHHINTLTRQQAKLTESEKEEISCWEKTVNRIFQSHKDNIMLEYTATVELENRAIQEKYADKIIYQYTLREFREDKFSKDVRILQSDLEIKNRVLQAIILSQYRRKVASKYQLRLKPVILFKSKQISDSKILEVEFRAWLKNLTPANLDKLLTTNSSSIIKNAYSFFKKEKITSENLIKEIQEEFSEEKCLAINSEADSEEKQLKVNSLEDNTNEIRAIFTVNMLNEGWDVLNLFDIVRLYDTRDARYSKVGKTTISEAQLIGRGARYWPFQLNRSQNNQKRKYDDDLTSELRLLEELHYHCLSEPRYISEITTALIKTGIKPADDKRKEITVHLKPNIKKTVFWNKGFIFLNDSRKNRNLNVKSIKDIISERLFKYKLRTGKSFETVVFAISDEEKKKLILPDLKRKVIRLNSINKAICRKALNSIDFYKFSNLKNYFPYLKSIKEFIESRIYLGQVSIEIYGTNEQLQCMANVDNLDIALRVLKELANKIKTNTSEYIGINEFSPFKIADIVAEQKTSEILMGSSDREYGMAMSQTTNSSLFLDLSKKEWYIYDENYGTDQEKYCIQFINHSIAELKKTYRDIYLLRNEGLFKIYKFSDGRAIMPDFALFLTDKKSKKQSSYQLFIESKGQQLFDKDKWKEDFLKDIESKYKLVNISETDKFRLIGLPFFNETSTKQQFEKVFRQKLNIKKK